MIERGAYMDQLRHLKDVHIIKVVTGIRRCGKSTLLEMFCDELLKNGVKKKQITYFNFEEAKNINLTNWLSLHNQIESKLIPEKMNYIFLDEVQNVKEFERMVDSLFVKKNVDLYITGSNAYLLSSELATLLSGRYIQIEMLPFSFSEFVQIYQDKGNNTDAFNQYLQVGAFPQAVEFAINQPNELKNYLTAVYDSVLEKDILTRKTIYHEQSFANVMKFAFDNIGNLTSPNNIANVLRQENKVVDKATVESYLSDLVNSYVLYRADRFDIKGKQQLLTQEKYFVVDLGLRRILLGRQNNTDLGHILENVVYLELLRRGYKVWIGKVDSQEIDFVVQTAAGNTEYFQVAQTAMDEKTKQRELGSLEKVRDHNPKYLLTLDPIDYDHNGIKAVNLIRWLLEI